MSRLAKKTITIPSGVKISSHERLLSVKGAKGELTKSFSDDFEIEIDGDKIKLKGDFNRRIVRTQAGLTFALINNMIKGVTEGYTKELEIVGVGYRAQAQGDKLNLQLGFTHPIVFPVPKGIKLQTPKPTQIIIQGIDKEIVGDVAAHIRAFSPPEPYKGKGIRYKDEYVRKKLGKAVTKE